MVNLQKSGDSAVKIVFTDSDHYLYGNGEIEVPVNSLLLVIDESEMVTFKKLSGDPFLSFRADNSNLGTKAAIEQFYKENMVGSTGGGISEEEVQEMIDAATSGIPSSQVIEQLQNDLNAVSGTVSSHTANTEVHVTQAEKNTWNGKVDEGYVTDYAYSKNQIDGFLENATTLLQTISGEVDTKVDTTTYESGQYATAQALNALQENKLDASAYTPTDLSEYWTSGQTQEAINAATSGIPSSQVIEALRNDINTVSGAVNTHEADIADLWDTIDEKEEVIASALTQLNQDVSDIDAKEEVIASALTEVRQNVDTLSGDVQTKVATSDFNAYSAATATALGNKQDALEYYTEDTSRESATIMVQKYDGAGNKTENWVSVGGGNILIENYNETDDGGISGTIGAQVDINSLGLSINAYSDDGENESRTELEVQPMGAYINSEPIATEPYVDAALSGKADTSAVTAVNGALTTHTADTTVHVSQAEKDIWNAKVDTSAITSIESSITAVSNDLNTLSGAVIDNEYTVSQAINELKSTKLDASAYTPTDLSQYWTSAQTQSAIDDAKAYFIDLDAIMSRGGLTDADWDGAIAAVNAHRPVYIKFRNGHFILESYALDDNTMYLTASDGEAASRFTIIKNGSNDYSLNRVIMNFVSDAEKERWNGKQDALSAGTNISIDTGNTISCTLPMRVINNTNIDGGAKNSSMSSASSSISYGKSNNFSMPLSYGAAFGYANVVSNSYQCSVGYASKSNYSTSTFGSSGNTLFTVGNGGAGEQVRHNAFEVRQNGDIYFPNTDDTTYQNFNQKPMVRLQDMYAALGGLKFVKLTQAEYSAMEQAGTLDANTLYIVTNVVS